MRRPKTTQPPGFPPAARPSLLSGPETLSQSAPASIRPGRFSRAILEALDNRSDQLPSEHLRSIEQQAKIVEAFLKNGEGKDAANLLKGLIVAGSTSLTDRLTPPPSLLPLLL